MIKIFRQFRYHVLNEGKAVRYLKYALGEIILVVIGILITLQINNWNENRKIPKQEFKLLSDIKANLKATLKEIEIDSISRFKQIQQDRKIEQYIYQDLIYTSDLDSAIGVLTFWNSPYITTTAYKTLQNKGLDLIIIEYIKNKITKIYEVEFQALLGDYDRTKWNLSENVVTPFVSKHIKRLDDNSLKLARPNDFETLKLNNEFINILSMLVRQRKRELIFYREIKISTT